MYHNLIHLHIALVILQKTLYIILGDLILYHIPVHLATSDATLSINIALNTLCNIPTAMEFPAMK